MHTRRVTRCGFPLVVAAFAVTAASAFATPNPPLIISGGFNATSARVNAGTQPACGYRPGRTLIYSSAAMRVGRGPTVARIEFFVRDYRGVARYDATAAAPYHRTAVQVAFARNAASGIASGFYVATAGSVSVVRAKNVGRHGRWASLSGNVHATLVLQSGSAHLRLDGGWYCRIDPAENGTR